MTTGLLLTLALLGQASPSLTWTVRCDRPTVQVPSTLYGIFFEEINHAGDGGLYAEQLPNRAFRDGDRLEGWAVKATAPSEAVLEGAGTSRVVRVRVAASSPVELSNGGYWGISAHRGQPMRLSILSVGPGEAAAELRGSAGALLASKRMQLAPGGAKAVLSPSSDDPGARLVLRFERPGEYVLRQVSLMPADTFKGRANGLRKDLASALDELKPGFVRFPGGCWVEGDTLATSYRWKTTIGPVHERRTVQDLWGYMSNNGLGFHEYLQMCEDLGAEPLFVINCGMSHHGVVPLGQMPGYVQDALDALEYANGPVTSKWGALRAANGHPSPFHLRMMEIGNENGGAPYEARYPLFVDAIRKRYPDVTLIADVWGGIPKRTPVEMMDEHYYSDPSFFYRNANRYDGYDRKGPKVYVGEYAVTEGGGAGNLKGALAESAFMMGMERNSDVVRMASYAPLLANVSATTWNPDLIYFDSSRMAATPSYWVQRLFARNRPDSVLDSTLSGAPEVSYPFQAGGFGVGTWRTQAEFKDFRVTRDGQTLFASGDGHELRREGGEWKQQDGALAQTGPEEGTRAWFGDPSWDRYTLDLKARKLSGDEGFLITVGRKDDQTFLWWNVGGWGNTQTAFERDREGGRTMLGAPASRSIETGRWYDVRVEYSPDLVRGYLDGKLVMERRPESLRLTHGIAGRVAKEGTVVLKVVNGSEKPEDVSINLQGLGASRVEGVAEVLTSHSDADRNTLDTPNRVAPTSTPVPSSSLPLHWTLKPHSLTILRLKGAMRG